MGSIYRRGQTYWVKYYRAGRPFRESTNSEKIGEAKHLLALREGQVVEGRFPGLKAEKIRFEELAQDYVRDYEINGKKTLRDAKRTVEVLKTFFGGFRMVEVTSGRINEYIHKRRDDGLSNASINREISALKRIFHLAARQQPPKVHQVPVISMLKERNTRTGFFEHDEFLSLRGSLPDHQKLPISIGYWTGMRLGEVLMLRWDQVDFTHGLLRLDPGTTKSEEGRVVPLMGDLPEVLTRWRMVTVKARPDCPWVCHYNGERLTRLTTAWKHACQLVGLKGRLFHDLRRTAIRNMVRAGISERVAMQISGHKTRSVFDRYDIVNERDLHEAAARLRSQFATLTPVLSRDILNARFDRDRHNLGTIRAHRENSKTQVIEN